ncbi:uncharacterized protein LOC102703412 isoform X2 [Oryza brachyantha]|uniref:uncharacterized protein LOC102703412 isoform X2 n=1 Tax=Oryza brachyantha TaxID=4533 RepID=UPI0007762403|nr:uncharacterized protein LOC102703412 isoform X2 [Oryza brachyantha]
MSKKKSKSQLPAVKAPLIDGEQGVTSDYIGGDDLDDLLSKLTRSVEVAKASRGGLPEKIWMKRQFAIGVNDVTRVLERMPAAAVTQSGPCSSEAQTGKAPLTAPSVSLQVPVLCLKDNKESSLRLGQVVNVRTALAIGVKARDSIINKAVDEALRTANLVANES